MHQSVASNSPEIKMHNPNKSNLQEYDFFDSVQDQRHELSQNMFKTPQINMLKQYKENFLTPQLLNQAQMSAKSHRQIKKEQLLVECILIAQRGQFLADKTGRN